MFQLQPLHQTTPLGDAPRKRTDTGIHYDHPQSAENQALQGYPRFSDSSGPLFAMYLKFAEEQDKERAEILRTDTDQILVFCGLFSATVGALLVMSMPDLKPSHQDVLAATLDGYLLIIQNVLADPGQDYTDIDLSSGIELEFERKYATYVTWVNLFWLLSLLISLTCALLAISIQQWARRHAEVTPPRYSLHEQARLRAFFTAGIKRSKFDFIPQALLVLVHLSLLLFFAGFLAFMLEFAEYYTGPVIFIISCCWIGSFTAAYLFATFLPIFLPDSPYHTPLSIPVAFVYSAIQGAVFRTSCATARSKDRYSDFSSWDMMRFAEEEAEEVTSEIDGDVLKRTLDALNTDEDLEEFFGSVIGFCSSKAIDDPQRSLDILGRERLVEAVDEFWNNTTSSSASISESVKERRLILCERLINVADLGMTLRHTDVTPTAGGVGRPHTTRPTPPMFPAPVLAGVAAP